MRVTTTTTTTMMIMQAHGNHGVCGMQALHWVHAVRPIVSTHKHPACWEFLTKAHSHTTPALYGNMPSTNPSSPHTSTPRAAVCI